MKLYKISQNERNGYDTFDSAIVAAASEDEARNIHPEEKWLEEYDYTNKTIGWTDTYGTWATDPKNVEVEYIGEAAPHVKRGVIVGSFNAG